MEKPDTHKHRNVIRKAIQNDLCVRDEAKTEKILSYLKSYMKKL